MVLMVLMLPVLFYPPPHSHTPLSAFLFRQVRQLIEEQVVDILNGGDEAELMALYGGGPKRAQYIIGEQIPKWIEQGGGEMDVSNTFNISSSSFSAFF